MLRIGNYNNLKIARITASGALLSSEAGEILLPGRLVPKGAEPGTLLNVHLRRFGRPADGHHQETQGGGG